MTQNLHKSAYFSSEIECLSGPFKCPMVQWPGSHGDTFTVAVSSAGADGIKSMDAHYPKRLGYNQLKRVLTLDVIEWNICIYILRYSRVWLCKHMLKPPHSCVCVVQTLNVDKIGVSLILWKGFNIPHMIKKECK